MKALLLILLLAVTAQAQTSGFVVLVGADTIAVENFTLTVQHLEGELLLKGAPRMPYRRELASDTLPFLNVSFAHVEVATRRAVERGQDSARVLFAVGPTTLAALLRRTGPQSMVLGLGGVDLMLTVDAAGRILRGAVPSQNLTFERTTGARLGLNKQDYSAPPDAQYVAEQVTIATPSGHTLAGTLTLPKRGKPPYAVVVTISGSGLQDRDESLPGVSGYRPFRQLAEALAQAGIAVLRYDDRGYGESTGDAAQATTADFALDTRAVLAYLRQRSDVDRSRLFLLGHSEGGMIAPLVAAQDASLRGIVLLAAPAWDGRRIITYQTGGATAQAEAMATKQPWLRYFLEYDPLSAARQVTVPVLILQGETDRQVTAEQAPELAAAMREAGNADVSMHVLPGVNHLFLEDAQGHPAGYAALPDKTVVANAVAHIVEWILKHASK